MGLVYEKKKMYDTNSVRTHKNIPITKNEQKTVKKIFFILKYIATRCENVKSKYKKIYNEMLPCCIK